MTRPMKILIIFLVFINLAIYGAYIAHKSGIIDTIYLTKSRQKTTTLSNISELHTFTPVPETSSTYKLIFVGDVMLGRTVMTKTLELQDPAYPFLNVSEVLNDADFAFANLENPVVSDCPIHTTGFKFCSPPESLNGLVFSGIDMVSLANNHSRNYGTYGVNETKRLLREEGIKHIDTNEPNFFQIGNLRVSFAAFDFVDKLPSETDYQEIYRTSKESDFTIVSVHWGVEYTANPTTQQKQWSQEMVKNGADLIIGHHPHWVQGGECFDAQNVGTYYEQIDSPDFSNCKNKRVFYSLGNFVFDQMWSEETKKGAAVVLTINEDGEVVNQEIRTTYMSSWAQPEFIFSLDKH